MLTFSIFLKLVVRSYLIREEGRYVVIKYKGSETCYVDNVKLCGSESGSTELNKICITYRIPVS